MEGAAAPDLLVTTPRGYEPERAYAARVLLTDLLGLGIRLRHEDRDDVSITLEGDAGGERLLVADVFFRTPIADWLGGASLPSRPLAHWKPEAALRPASTPEPLPVLFGHPLPGGGYLDICPREARLGLDLFGSAFFMLTRYEEIAVGERDEHERFGAGSSLAAQEGFLGRPIVNEYLDVLWSLLARLWPRLERAPRAGRVLISHDVDWPSCTARTLRGVLRACAGDTIARRDPALALDRLGAHARVRAGRTGGDLCDTFDFIMAASERRGLSSAFYFITRHTAGEIDGTYSIDDPPIRALMRRIHRRGHEIGLHPSYHTYRDAAQTRSELEELLRACDEEGIRQPIWGGRQHYLRWANPATWQNWEDAGLSYDSTLSFADQPGFRCGVCYEYPTFNLKTRTALTLVERPLVVMEHSILREHPVGSEAMHASIAALSAACRRHVGDFTLLWHNSRLISRRERRAYEQVLDVLVA